MEELREFLDKYDVKYTIKGEYIIGGDVNLSHKGITELPESIGNLKCNYLDLYKNKITKLPESIGNLRCNNLNLGYNQITELPESIGNLKCNYLDLYKNKISVLPESIGNLKCNELWLSFNQISKLPESISNIKCNYLNLEYNNLIETPKYDKYKFDNIDITNDYINCDGIFSWFNSIKTIGEYTVYIGYGNYIVTKDNTTFAHGKSIRQAISDLIFKVSDRDKSKYIGLDHDKSLTVNEAIVMYRIITGACSSGVEGFLQGKDIPDSVTVNYILSILRENDYGYKEFKEFFK